MPPKKTEKEWSGKEEEDQETYSAIEMKESETFSRQLKMGMVTLYREGSLTP